MPALQRRIGAPALLPDEFRAGLERRIRQASGLVLVGLAMLCTAALVTWSVKDPSLSHATSAPVRNLLGVPGAIAADLFMQLFGLATLALVGPVAAWGWRLANQRRFDRERWRVLAWAVGAPLAAGFAACLPRSAAWPLPSGLGGVIGDFLVRGPATLLPAGWGYVSLAAVYGLLALGAMVFASGFGFAEVDEETAAKAPARKPAAPPPVREPEADDEEDGSERASVSLGFLVHSMLSLKARALRLARHGIAAGARLMKTSREPDIDHFAFERREPRFDGEAADAAERRAFDDAPPFDAADEAEIEEDVEEEEDEEPAPKRARKPPARKPPAKAKASEYELPSINLLAAPKASDRHAPSMELIKANEAALQTVLGDFGVRGEILDAHPGPVVTLYELEPAPGIKSSRVIGLADDIARSMSAVSARVAVVPGRNVIGIELPNATREKIYLREMLAAEQYHDSSAKLPLCLGKTIGGDPVIVDLARMPHLLIAGTTGSGKSVAVNTMILSLLYRLRPDQCRLIMVDPKMLELSVYDGIPHLLTPVVTDPKKAVVALKWAVREMESRYKKLSKVGVRNIDGYNARLAEAKAKGERLTRTVHTGYDKETGTAIYETEELDLEPLPYIVVVVDEMADLMMVAGKDIEGAVQRLAQMARAAGLHVIIATQRPSVDVITGTIKANFPTRISFQVTSKIDSRTILGEQGAEQLLGQGDMLYMAGGGRISRVHGPFVSDEEVEKIVRHLQAQGTPQYVEEVTAEEPEGDGEAVFDGTAMGQEGGDLYQQAVQVVLRDRKASTSYIQRRLQVGYNKAASLMERMEQEGIVGQANHAGKREILVGGDGAEDSF
ncbi:DNA translocase FtsK [Rhodoplanes sp. TEM]|uniref:DNA translocase FtsK n=1 Tax=Rhodoplanes tepidamans TaxID=200616 RepID=A0ABT5J3P9_RHOTP|nr:MULTISPECIES: DNA translocase FtsK [Rhodoplanes]MDC7784272.1 DNA translocase FtsK [Rhodoplanes tepidamans]MDC7983664.1 DNA translocase FtsK [Rhodoplanes sp. TEM]MDQ0353674.1 S-DNA-T family DNA segregation ATPase FtsK/SpoIIIE [Rhodoplanes tepidamans]